MNEKEQAKFNELYAEFSYDKMLADRLKSAIANLSKLEPEDFNLFDARIKTERQSLAFMKLDDIKKISQWEQGWIKLFQKWNTLKNEVKKQPIEFSRPYKE